VSGNTLEAFTSVVVHADAKHPDIYVDGDVPESPVFVHATHVPVEFFWYPLLHVFLHAPDASGDTLEAFTSVVVQADALQPEEYVVTVVPKSPVLVHGTHAPEEFLVYPGLHVFLQTPEASGDTPDAFTSVVVQADAVQPEEYVVTVVPKSFNVVHVTQVPEEFLVNPGLHTFRQTLDKFSAPDAFGSVVVHPVALHVPDAV
jgi:ATP-dependent Clp protease adapter protein ClpS